jgi:hypothetical protein
MAEIIIFNKLLTSGEVTIINQYIKQEYDLWFINILLFLNLKKTKLMFFAI